MAVYCIKYDLRDPFCDYTPLATFMDDLNSDNCMGTFWIVDSPAPLDVLYERIQAYLHPKDVLFICELKQHWKATGNLPCKNWLGSAGRSWSDGALQKETSSLFRRTHRPIPVTRAE